jgi:hypothetical protein
MATLNHSYGTSAVRFFILMEISTMKLFQRAALALIALTIASPVLAADATVAASANDPAAATATVDTKADIKPAAGKHEMKKAKKHHKKAAKAKAEAAKEDAKADAPAAK